MKRISFSRVAFLWCMTLLFFAANGQNVNIDQAKKVAQRFYAMQKSVSDWKLLSVDEAYRLNAQQNQETIPCLYVFNIEQSFVIVAAQQVVSPILGYSWKDRFVETEMPQGLSDLFNRYCDEMVFQLQNNVVATAATKAQWRTLLSDSPLTKGQQQAIVNPLLTTTWDQNFPYNNQCPAAASGPGGRVYAGCVATAMAQIMNYWQYPSCGFGSHSYSSNYGTLSADFGHTAYRFDQMPDHLNDASQEEIDAVATLMFQCGVSVDMNYGVDESSSSTTDAAVSLRSYFGYSSTVFVLKNDYSSNDWIALMKSEIDAGRPVIYSGSSDYSGGHAFICDGYDASDYFHFNWGWSGSYNGYFALTVLNPGEHDFSEEQTAIIHIEPDSFCQPPVNLEAVVDNHDVEIDWSDVQQGHWISWSDELSGISIGTGEAIEFDVAQRFSTTDLTDIDGHQITQLQFVPSEKSCSYSIRIWTGGSQSQGPETLLLSQDVDVNDLFISQWNTVILNNPVTIDASEELWIGYHCNTSTGNPAGCDAGPQVAGKGNMININGSWKQMTDLSSSLTYNWCIRAYIDLPNKNTTSSTAYRVLRNGIVIADEVTTSYYLDRDVEGGYYCYTVKTVCENSESVPSENACVELEIGDCFAPTQVTAHQEEAEVLIEWEAPTTTKSEFFNESFENGLPDDWITMDADGDGYQWMLDSTGLSQPHTGRFYVASASFMLYVGALTPDNWLITPKINIDGDHLVYWVSAKDEDWAAEHYGVYISTTGTAVEDFTLLFEETMSDKNNWERETRDAKTQGDWYRRVIDLSEFSGDVYIAFRHFNATDWFMLLLDDVLLTTNPVENTYIIYRNDHRIASTSETFYRDSVADGNYCYSIKTACEDNEESALSQEACIEVAVQEWNPICQVYPNPSDQWLIVRGVMMQELSVYNLLGQKVYHQTLNAETTTFSTAAFVDGVYILQIKTTSGKIMMQRLIVHH
ncbi:MAG: C10 family peptidase [Bacteroidales bacterium]|nr:C10 family peptidase [Bacteroidales bacterium]